VRAQRHDEVVQSVAGVVGRYDDRTIGPVVVLRSFELAVVARLRQTNAKLLSLLINRPTNQSINQLIN